MLPTKKLGLLALIISAGLIWILPTASLGRSLDLKAAGEAQRQATQRLLNNVKQTVIRTEAALRQTSAKATAAAQQTKRADKRATATDPETQPPLHGANPHGQGTVAVVDLDPSSDRPLSGDPDGGDSHEEVVVGRARGEQVTAGGANHGHITILALLGTELAGVDTTQGQTKHGPLDSIQTGILDPLCKATDKGICLSVLTADSTTTATGSKNDFAVARADVYGLRVGAAESNGSVTKDANCQESIGQAKTANVSTPRGAVAQVANSKSTSKSCRGEKPKVDNGSRVVALFGKDLTLLGEGCEKGTPDAVIDLVVATIVCNADDVAGAAAVREALDVFVLSGGGSSLLKESTAAAESLSVAPAGDGKDDDSKGGKGPGTTGSGGENSGPACSDKRDNDNDGKVDGADPGCHSDGNANNPASFVPADNDETDPAAAPATGPATAPATAPATVPATGPATSGSQAPGSDPGSADESDDGGSGTAGTGASGDGDDAAASGAQPLDDGSLPFTGAEVIGVALAGLLLLAGGLLMRRREGLRTGL